MGLLSAIAGPLIGGLFSSKSQKKQNDANVENTLLQLPRLRQSAEDAGFNPLTALMSGASGGFNVQTRHAPLASAGAITNALEGVDDILSGKKARDRERQQVVDDLNKLNLERAKAGTAGGVASKTSSLAPLPHSRAGSSLGTKPARAAPVQMKTAKLGAVPNPITPDREIEVMSTPNVGGVFELENTLTGGPVYIPGDSEPWGIDEVLTAAIVGGPQVVYNKIGQNLRVEEVGPKKRSTPEELRKRAKKEKEERRKSLKRHSDKERKEFMRDKYPTVFD